MDHFRVSCNMILVLIMWVFSQYAAFGQGDSQWRSRWGKPEASGQDAKLLESMRESIGQVRLFQATHAYTRIITYSLSSGGATSYHSIMEQGSYTTEYPPMSDRGNGPVWKDDTGREIDQNAVESWLLKDVQALESIVDIVTAAEESNYSYTLRGLNSNGQQTVFFEPRSHVFDSAPSQTLHTALFTLSTDTQAIQSFRASWVPEASSGEWAYLPAFGEMVHITNASVYVPSSLSTSRNQRQANNQMVVVEIRINYSY
ncbi:hypothetical protein K8I28_13935 [bacterium]|nr:hypothetical protein [bacterium]